MKIVVLAGGISTEREVSLVTGKGVCDALRKNGHKAVLLDVFFGYNEEGASLECIFEKESLLSDEVCGIDVTDPDIEEVKKLRKGDSSGLLGPNVLNICRMADIVFMALHGADGENGRLQAAFDILGIKYTGSGSFGSSLAMDKFISKKILKDGGIPVPYGFLITKKEIKEGLDGSKMLQDSMFPCVVKPCCGGSSVGVSIAKNREEYMQALDTALKGFYDYKTKYQPGMADDVCPADINGSLCNNIQEYAKKVYHMLKLEAYARVDFILDANGGIYCLEANTLPGMTPTSLLPQEAGAINISYRELCEKIVKASLEKYGV